MDAEVSGSQIDTSTGRRAIDSLLYKRIFRFSRPARKCKEEKGYDMGSTLVVNDDDGKGKVDVVGTLIEFIYTCNIT